jgi:hypothetical protein
VLYIIAIDPSHPTLDLLDVGVGAIAKDGGN